MGLREALEPLLQAVESLNERESTLLTWTGLLMEGLTAKTTRPDMKRTFPVVVTLLTLLVAMIASAITLEH